MSSMFEIDATIRYYSYSVFAVDTLRDLWFFDIKRSLT